MPKYIFRHFFFGYLNYHKNHLQYFHLHKQGNTAQRAVSVNTIRASFFV